MNITLTVEVESREALATILHIGADNPCTTARSSSSTKSCLLGRCPTRLTTTATPRATSGRWPRSGKTSPTGWSMTCAAKWSD